MKELMILTHCPHVDDPELQTAINALYEALRDYRNAAARAAYIAGQIDNGKLYERAGCKSAAEFIMGTFGVNKTMAYSMVKVGKRFMASLNESNLPHSGEKDFNFTQLEKMLPVGEDKRDKLVQVIEAGEITPDMSAKDISKVVATLKDPKEPADGEAAEGCESAPEEVNEEQAVKCCCLGDIQTVDFKMKDSGEPLADWVTNNNVNPWNTPVKVLPENVVYIYVDRIRKNGKIYADVLVAVGE